MKNAEQHQLARYFEQPSELGNRQTHLRTKRKPLLLWIAVVGATLLAVAANVAIAAAPYANATVEGALLPGVYGRIEIGTAPPPPLLYPQPIVIVQQPVLVQQPPLYLHVPPGHAKKWSKHCGRYNACGRPVYFVKVDGDDNFERVQYKKSKEDKGYKQKKEKHHENGN
jgi:hypothetical protein